MAVSSHITQLPEELLQDILLRVKANVSKDEWWDTCMKTCSQWHRIGLGLHDGLGFAVSATVESHFRRCNVKEEDATADFGLVTDLRMSPPSDMYLSQLRSLTLHIRHQRASTPFLAKSGLGMIDLLQMHFPTMKRLLVFSLKFSDGWDFHALDVPAIPQSMLAELVATLPDTIIDLELDTAGIDVPPSKELVDSVKEKHVCYQISEIITRLRHLRLRIGHVCSDLLASSPLPTCTTKPSDEQCTLTRAPTNCLFHSWRMKSMTVWLPWGQTGTNNTFAQAIQPLLDISNNSQATILLIHQTDRANPNRVNISTPNSNVYTNFLWTPQSNISPTSNFKDYFAFQPLSGLLTQPGRLPVSAAKTSAKLPQRDFYPTLTSDTHYPEPGGTTSHAYIAESTLESMLSWTQRRYGSYRYPISESDEEGKIWWKGPEIWHCLDTKCEKRGKNKVLAGLRGHIMYEHPGNV